MFGSLQMSYLCATISMLIVLLPGNTICGSGNGSHVAYRGSASITSRDIIQKIVAYFKGCHALVSPSPNVLINCTKTTKKVVEVLDCAKKVVSGTKATFKCLPGFVNADKHKFATCQTRKWNKPIITCKELVTTTTTTSRTDSTTETSTETSSEAETSPLTDQITDSTTSIDAANTVTESAATISPSNSSTVLPTSETTNAVVTSSLNTTLIPTIISIVPMMATLAGEIAATSPTTATAATSATLSPIADTTTVPTSTTEDLFATTTIAPTTTAPTSTAVASTATTTVAAAAPTTAAVPTTPVAVPTTTTTLATTTTTLVTTTLSTTTTTLDALGYASLGNLTSKYKAYPLVKLGWAAARNVCKTEGATLLVLNNNYETDLIVDFANKRAIIATHLGYTDWPTEGTWLTVQSQRLAFPSTVSWKKGQPNNLTDENCLAMDIVDRGLNDVSCSLRLRQYICEKPTLKIH